MTLLHPIDVGTEDLETKKKKNAYDQPASQLPNQDYYYLERVLCSLGKPVTH